MLGDPSSTLVVCFLVFIAFPINGKTENAPNQTVQIRKVMPRSTSADTNTSRNGNADLESIKSTPISVKALYDANVCGNFTVQDSEGYLLYSLSYPQQYTCEQNFTAANRNILLTFSCRSVALRFYCDLENLIVKTENTTFTFCSNSEIPVISGNSIYIKYERNIFGLHGGYLCTITAKGASQPYTASFSNCMNCGITALNNGTRSIFLSPPAQQRLISIYSGPITTRVVGGEDAQANEYPWMVYLEIVSSDGTFICGGTLVTNTAVITAAHCIDEKGVTKVRVYLGLHNRSEKSKAKLLTSNNFIMHPSYDRLEIVNDLAIIFLPTSVVFSNAIHPACLPSEFLGDLDGLTATATGWGFTSYDGKMSNTLQTVKLSLWSFTDCSKIWSSKGVYISVSQMCAYAENKDTCSGDSGGPLVVKLEDRWVLVGITSYGYECASPGLPGVYTRLSKLVRWVKDEINDTACY